MGSLCLGRHGAARQTDAALAHTLCPATPARPKLPILRLYIQRRLQCVPGDDSRLPVAHTCTRVVDLPAYSSQAALAKQLATALQHAEGGFHVL